jgi:hypothetical protein
VIGHALNGERISRYKVTVREEECCYICVPFTGREGGFRPDLHQQFDAHVVEEFCNHVYLRSRTMTRIIISSRSSGQSTTFED